MSNPGFADIAMGMKPMGTDPLPPWVTYLWLVALAAVLVFHCGHLVQMGAGQHRWYHASHILMLVSMLYMYASMEFRWTWLASNVQAVIFSMSTAAIVVWMVYRFVQRRPFSALWVLALIMQAAMIYMWLPSWAPALTWALVAYFALETVAWLAGLLDDTKPAMAVGPSSHGLRGSLPHGSLSERGSMSFGPGDRPVDVPLAQNTMLARVSMAVMAASMAYMFAAMQLMR
jgi:hypothetical protein